MEPDRELAEKGSRAQRSRIGPYIKELGPINAASILPVLRRQHSEIYARRHRATFRMPTPCRRTRWAEPYPRSRALPSAAPCWP